MTSTALRPHTAQETPKPPSSGKQARAGWRPDIQGMRGWAVLVVLLYHANVPGFTGGYVGVDIFFVISGYLITSHLYKRGVADGRINFSAFYAARFKRLAVPATVVTLTTLAVFWLIGSPLQFKEITTHAAAAATFCINYLFAFRDLSYQNAGGLPSPFLHYWSLAVEEQFYAIWPLLLAVAFTISRRTHKLTARRAALTIICVVTLASFAASIITSHTSANFAYFGLHTRAWELGIGSILALWAPALPAWAARHRSTLTTLAVIIMLGSVFVLSDNSIFPGYLAAWPVLAAALVIYLGTPVTKHKHADAHADAHTPFIVGTRPLRRVGDVSYSLYLWHWPVLLAPIMLLGRTPTWVEALPLLALSYLLAEASTTFIEKPARNLHLTPRLWIAMGAAMAVVCVIAAGGSRFLHTIPTPSGPTQAAISSDLIARTQPAAIRELVPAEAPKNLTPSIPKAKWTLPQTSWDDCHLDYHEIDQAPCIYGDPNGSKTIVLFGDSHAQQWFPPLHEAAKNRGLKLVSWTKAACPVADYIPFKTKLRRSYDECGIWRDQMIQRLTTMKPDAIITTHSDADANPGTPAKDWLKATQHTLDQLQRITPNVYYLVDTPLVDVRVPHCLARHLDDTTNCDIPRAGTHPDVWERTQASKQLRLKDGMLVDPQDAWCNDETCPAIVGNDITMRDTNHVSPPFAEKFSGLFETYLQKANL